MKLKHAHEKALRATLRVTLFAALGACGSGGGGGGTARTNVPVSNAPAAAETSGPVTEVDCRAALTAAFPNGDPNWFKPDEGTARAPTAATDAELVACCEAMTGPAATDDYRELGCCSTKFDHGHCTPWGPPTPPAMRARA